MKKEALIHKRFLITGQPGIGIKKCISKAFEEITSQAEDHETIVPYMKLYKVEDVILRLSNHETLKSFLKDNSYADIQTIWNTAIEEIIDSIAFDERNKEVSVYSFICSHMIFNHSKTEEYISFANPEKLKKLNIDKVIIFIDDINEIYNKLSQDGQIFYQTANNKPINHILELFSIQDWREKEIMLSRTVAQLLGCKVVLFAVKHPIKTFKNITIKNKSTAYLSHPISEVRRQLLSHEEDVKKADTLQKELEKFSRKARDYFALFEPTTIDEFRITEIKRDSKNIYIPKLLNRWDSYKYNSPPRRLYSKNTDKSLDDLWPNSNLIESSEEISDLLLALRSRISHQVTIRDYFLCEQSKYLIVFRPVYNGNISGGVNAEINYHAGLSISEVYNRFSKGINNRDNNVFVYCPIEDIIETLRTIYRERIIALKKSNYFICEEVLIKNDNGERVSEKLIDKDGQYILADSNIFRKLFVLIKKNIENELQLKLKIAEHLLHVLNPGKKSEFIKIDDIQANEIYGNNTFKSKPISEKTPLSEDQALLEKLVIIFSNSFLDKAKDFLNYMQARLFYIPPYNEDNSTEDTHYKDFFDEVLKVNHLQSLT